MSPHLPHDVLVGCWQSPASSVPSALLLLSTPTSVFCQDPGRKPPPTLSSIPPPFLIRDPSWEEQGLEEGAVQWRSLRTWGVAACPLSPAAWWGQGVPPRTLSPDLGEEAAESKACKACSDLIASLFPRKPQESFFEFLLILATPAPPPGTGLGEQDSRALHLAEGAFHSSAVKSQPETGREANLSC